MDYKEYDQRSSSVLHSEKNFLKRLSISIEEEKIGDLSICNQYRERDQGSTAEAELNIAKSVCVQTTMRQK